MSDAAKQIAYPSSADGTEQPALFYAPETKEPVPLLVGLHTWSVSYTDPANEPYAQWCIEHGWGVILPDFRGPNNRPEATGSELVVEDILSAVEYAKGRARVDARRVYLVGASGGGYTAFLMAGRAPDVWAGVSAWVPIADLRAWHEECTKAGRVYAQMIEASCGGPPGTDPPTDLQYAKRSPATYLRNARGVPLDINAGILDGHTGSVPISHSLVAFNLVAEEADRISPEDIRHFVEKAETPPHLRATFSDPDYGRAILFRRSSGNARITIFDGGHEILYNAALGWLARQAKGA